MSVTLSTPPSVEPFEPPPAVAPAVRLALKTEGGARGLLDGAWWPRSRDLLIELPELTEVLDARWGRITRVAVNPLHWPVIPRRVPVNGRVVKVGWFTPEIDVHTLLLLSYGTGRWDLLVIPPETDAESAAWLMAAASDHDGPPMTASALIAASDERRAPTDTDVPVDRAEAWEDEGGAPARTGAVMVDADGRPSRLIVGM